MDERDSVIADIAKAAADYASENFRSNLDVEEKSSKIDPVTRTDRETQRRIVSSIEERYPNDRIVGEEGNQEKTVPEAGFTWIIDPIDGTHNYTREMNEWVTSIALVKDAEPVAATTVAPQLGEAYIATTTGVHRNGTPISVNKNTDPESYLVASTLRLNTEDNSRIGTLADEVIARFGEFRRIGSAQLTLSLVASGSLDAVVGFEMDPHPWDTVAGAFQIQQAGGTVTDLYGNHWAPGSPGIVASNGENHERVIEVAKKTAED